MSEEKKEVTQKVIKAKEKAAANSQVMYVGPTIPGKIIGNTTFKNGMPKTVKDILQDNPFIKGLFIPVSEIADARKQLAEKNSYLAVLYNKAKTLK